AVVSLTALIRRSTVWLIGAVAVAALCVWAQLSIAADFPDFYGWLRPVMVVAVVAGLLALAFAALRPRLPLSAGLAVVVAGLLLLPAAWSGHELADAALNFTLPQAGPRLGPNGQTFGSRAFDNGITQLAAWVSNHTDPNARWQLAVASAQNAST